MNFPAAADVKRTRLQEHLVTVMQGPAPPVVDPAMLCASRSISRLVAALSELAAQSDDTLVPLLEDLYAQLEPLGSACGRLVIDTELIDHLMRLLHPRFSSPVFYHTLVIFSDILLQTEELMGDCRTSGFQSLIGDLIMSGKLEPDLSPPIIFSAAELAEADFEFRALILRNDVLRRLLCDQEVVEHAEVELCHLCESVMMVSVDGGTAELIVPFLISTVESGSPLAVRKALRALAQALRAFHFLRDIMGKEDRLAWVLELVSSGEHPSGTRMMALKFFTDVVQYNLAARIQHVTIDLLNGLSDMIQEDYGNASLGFQIMRQLVADCEEELYGRVHKSHVFETATAALGEADFDGAAEAASFLVEMMGGPAEGAALAAYRGAFDECFRLMLECDMDKWRIRGLDGLLAFLARLTRTGGSDIAEEVVGREWLRAILQEIATSSAFAPTQNAATVLLGCYFKK
jgi:hypothetical protein